MFGKEITGVDVDLAHILAQKFQFTFDVVLEPLVGKIVPGTKDEWLGVVGSVKNGTSSFGIGNIALDPARYTVADYSTMLYSLDTIFIAPKPKVAPHYLNIIKPFSPLVWILTLASMLIVTFTMVMTAVVATRTRPDTDVHTKSHALLFPYASIMRQGNSFWLFKHLPQSLQCDY